MIIVAGEYYKISHMTLTLLSGTSYALCITSDILYVILTQKPTAATLSFSAGFSEKMA